MKRLADAKKLTEEIINISLGHQRNSLLLIDVHMNAGTFSLAAGGVVAGVFGMNLTSTLESTPGAFLLVTGGVVIITGTLWRLLMHRVRMVTKYKE